MTAIIDWYSRYVLSWRISDNMEIDFVLEASRLALEKGTPEIMNSDQGSHFTSPQYTEIFLNAGSTISMYHRGRAYDNIFIERLWRTVKYENVYPKSYESPCEARTGINQYMITIMSVLIPASDTILRRKSIMAVLTQSRPQQMKQVI